MTYLDDIKHLSRSKASNEIKALIQSPKINNKKYPGLDKFTAEFYQTFKELAPILLKLFHKIEWEEMLLNSFCEASVTLIFQPGKDTTKTQNIPLMNIDVKNSIKYSQTELKNTLKYHIQ
jgi:hypothetical protein